ncbi:MAG: glycerate kinase type-2 family protein [Syntrophales bacterium]
MAEGTIGTGHSSTGTIGSRNGSSVLADARAIFTHALACVLPEPAIRRYLHLDETANTLTVAGRIYDLRHYRRIVVVGGGKAGRRTGSELVNILGERITAGALNVYQEQAREPISGNIKLFAASHPTPNEAGVEGARRMVELLKGADSRTLVIALISGGGSSLMALPVPGISLEDYVDIINLLLTVPATIDEVNAVRKHLDPLKGGGMRKMAKDAGGFISLVLSDVPVTKTGVVDDPSVISSGPTVGDDSTFASAKKVLTDHNIWAQAPPAVKRYFEGNLGREENETLPMDSPLLAADRSQYVMIANNDLAMEAAGEKAGELGYAVHLIGCRTGSVADKIKAEVTREIEDIWKVIASYLIDRDCIAFASFSTDGVDGHSDLAGAVADEDTLALARGKGLDYRTYLAGYDSATFFKALGLEIKTGPTGTNVADVSIALITNPDKPGRRIAIIFGGEATVNVNLPEGKKPGYGGRNTHLVLLAARKLAERK